MTKKNEIEATASHDTAQCALTINFEYDFVDLDLEDGSESDGGVLEDVLTMNQFAALMQCMRGLSPDVIKRVLRKKEK